MGVVISAEVTLAGTTGGVAVATAGTVVVTAGVGADHMVVGIAAVATGVLMGMAAAGTGTEVVRIGMGHPFTGGLTLTVTARLTTTTNAVLQFLSI